MNKKIILVLIAAMIFLSFCSKEVKTIPPHLRKGTAEYHMNNGYTHLNRGSLNIAMEQFQKSLKKKPGLMKASMGLGIVYLKQMKFKESLKLFADVAKRYPSNADAFNFMGVIQSELKNYKSAKENFLIAANSPHYSTPENAYLNLALLELKFADFIPYIIILFAPSKRESSIVFENNIATLSLIDLIAIV